MDSTQEVAVQPPAAPLPESSLVLDSIAPENDTAAPPDAPPPVDPSPSDPDPPILENAYWAELEEDTSSPDEAEMKEIESAADSDYSAYEYNYWEKNFHPELDDPEYRPIEKGRLTWKIQGVRGTKENPNRAKIMRSPPAYVGGYWWTVKFFPRGNNVNSLSIYLECSPTMPQVDKSLPDSEFKVLRGPADSTLGTDSPEVDVTFPEDGDVSSFLEEYKALHPPAPPQAEGSSKPWRVSAQIGVILYNPNEPRTGWMQSSSHQFNPHNLDWGWTNFHGPWDQIQRRQRGQRQALLRNDTLAFDAYIRIVDDPTQSLWWHASDTEPTWDSLGLTGYRPLGDSVINHSAEVAGLATWLHLAPFCKIIQNVNVLEHLSNCYVKPRPVCDALQKFLWQLRSRSHSLQYVDTDGITSTLRNMHEYSGDVCGFWERLRRSLELELAGTEFANDLARLFDSPSADNLIGGPQVDAINTIPKEHNSRICVQADQVKTTSQAFEQYLSSRPGRWTLPPVLHLELGRQTLDMVARQWRLLYNRVEPDEEIDLSPWLLDGQCGKYVLYGYVVHRGRRTSGKFFSIMRPAGPGTKWLAFDDGSDNRVECLTRKTAFGPHLGLDETQKPDHKTGHDVATAIMYIRSDVVADFLPGPQGPWDASPAMKEYYENGTYPLTQTPEGKPAEDIRVEVYSLPQYDQLPSLFDTYDLMAQAKAANKVMYLTSPRSSNLVELRRKIAVRNASANGEQTKPENVRLWKIGQTGERLGPTLAFDRVADLKSSLDLPLNTVRYWMQVVSDADAKYYAMADPQEEPVVVENKPESEEEEATEQREPEDAGAQRDQEHSSSGNVPDQELSETNGTAPAEPTLPEESAPVESSPDNDTSGGAPTSNEENDAVIAAIIAEEVQRIDDSAEAPVENPNPVLDGPTVLEEQTESASAPVEEAAPASAPETSEAPEVAQPVETAPETSETPETPEVAGPVDHTFYFIQTFDVEAQALKTVGSFFSQKEENIKKALRKHLQWPVMKDFQVWQRVDGTTVSAVASGETFEACVPDGVCFIVGDKLNKEKRSEFNEAGLLTNPDHLVQYLWSLSRNHPTKAFTGTKTIEATFTNDFYSGDFVKGYHHGQGKHVSDLVVTYAGSFVLDKRHGQGFMEYPTGDTYDGDWVENQCHGQGMFIEKETGNKYVGGYKDGKRHGKGISYWEVADEEKNLCQICYSDEQDALFYDCGHVCACVTCAKQVDICPICRKNIISVVKIYRT